ncbi:MAG: FAD-dependent oxidoreductase [Deltaproteobacteria bacterium]|nr:FAD-dependent oxidoreductase [Deltaproteobacteria bacterium]
MAEPYDIIIIGGGPAGAAAAVYAARKRLKILLITEQFGGQSLVSANIENWIGEVSISGKDLADKLEKHVRAQKEVEIKTDERVVQVKEGADCLFEVSTKTGGKYRTKTLIITSGGRRKRLGVPGEDRFDGRGVAFCSTCDAPFFEGKDVAVVGSGNSALETVIDLIPYAKTIYLLMRGDKPKGDPIAEEKAKASSKLKIIKNVEVQEIQGDRSVTGLRYKDVKSGESKKLEVQGVFVAIGSTPNSDIVRGLVDTNQAGEILVDQRTAKTSKWGIFAAGDVTNDPYKQNNISAGDAVRAALSAYLYILDIQKYSPCAEGGE